MVKLLIGCFVIVLACLSAGALLSFLEKSKDEVDEDHKKDVDDKIFRFPQKENDKWMLPSFILGIVGFLGLYGAIFLLEPFPFGFYAIFGFAGAIAQRNNSRSEYVRIENEKYQSIATPY